MQAIVLIAHGSAENFQLAEWPLPPLRKGDIRIRVRSVSFNPIDYQLRNGTPEGRSLKSPILGRDLCGVVDAVDETVDEFRPGDEVYSNVCNLASSGTYTEYVSVPSELVAKMPTSLTHNQAASVPVAGTTALLAMIKAGVDKTSSVFVAGGAGGVGSFVIALAQRAGVARLITTAGSPASQAYLINHCGLNADQIVDYKDDDFIAQAIARNKGPFDCVLDLVGGRLLSAGCRLLGVEGHLASITEAPNREDFELLFDKNASFHSISANVYSLTEDRASWRHYQRMLSDLAEFYDAGALRPPHIVDVGAYSVDTVREAHRRLEHAGVQGKLVMSFR